MTKTLARRGGGTVLPPVVGAIFVTVTVVMLAGAGAYLLAAAAHVGIGPFATGVALLVLASADLVFAVLYVAQLVRSHPDSALARSRRLSKGGRGGTGGL